jgi:AcrR family transcriptional regulator
MTIRQTDITRDKLLQAAFCEIHRQGFQAASISNILQNTGLTKGALYHHFPTKQELGLAVIEEVIRARLEELIFQRLRDSEQPVQTLLQIIENLGGRTDTAIIALGCPLNNLMQEMSLIDEAFKLRLNDILQTWSRVVEDALQREQESGSIRPQIDCHASALFIVSAWEGCIGIAKSLQSAESLHLCMQQLQGYIRSLMVVSIDN